MEIVNALKFSRQQVITLIRFFVDNRKKSQSGRTLFITSEGNAGFMEVGSFTSVAKELGFMSIFVY